MGRKKIKIEPLEDERARQVTFMKRRFGLFKKAHELAVLSESDVTVLITNWQGRNYQFSSRTINGCIEKYGKVARTNGIAEHRIADDFKNERTTPQTEPVLKHPEIPTSIMADTQAVYNNIPLTPASKAKLEEAYRHSAMTGEAMPKVMVTSRTPTQPASLKPSASIAASKAAAAARNEEAVQPGKRKAPSIIIPSQQPMSGAIGNQFLGSLTPGNMMMPPSAMGGMLGRPMLMSATGPILSPWPVQQATNADGQPSMMTQGVPGQFQYPAVMTPMGYPMPTSPYHMSAMANQGMMGMPGNQGR